MRPWPNRSYAHLFAHRHRRNMHPRPPKFQKYIPASPNSRNTSLRSKFSEIHFSTPTMPYVYPCAQNTRTTFMHCKNARNIFRCHRNVNLHPQVAEPQPCAATRPKQSSAPQILRNLFLCHKIPELILRSRKYPKRTDTFQNPWNILLRSRKL